MDLKPLEVNKDERGTLVEAFRLPTDGQVFYVVIKPHETRGNHYHRRKTEKFLVIYGSAKMMVKNRKTGDMMNVEVSGFKPMLVTVTPNHTHNITATDEGAVVMIWVDELYNDNDPDTIREEV